MAAGKGDGMTEAAIVGVLGLVVLAISAYLHVNDKDGSEWGFVALLLIIHSCSKAG